MPNTVFKWRIYCTTENAWTEGWLNSDDPEPTTCFTDNSHTINPNSLQKTDTVSEIIESSLVSTSNSTSTPLSPDTQFIGTSDNVSKYTSITVIVQTDQNSAFDGLVLEFSADNSIWYDIKKKTVVSPGTHIHVTVAAKYFRVRYTNGSTLHTIFNIQTVLKTFNSIENPTVTLEENIDHVPNLPLQRSVITGRTIGNKYKNVQMDSENGLEVSISNPTTALGDLRMASLVPQVEINFKYNINKFILKTDIIGSGSIASEDSMGKLTVTSSNSSVEVRSRKVAKYYTGQGLLVRFGAFFNTPVTGSKQLAGLGHDGDGVYIGTIDTNIAIIIVKDEIYDNVIQSSFNVDKLDGTGPSGMIIDITKGNVFQIQFQWNGFGNIKFYVQEENTGKYTLFHNYLRTNLHNVVTVSNPIFAIRGCIENTTNNTEMNMNLSGMAIFNEGKISKSGPVHYIDNIIGGIGKDNYVHLLSIRNKTVYNSATNHIQIFILDMGFSNDHNSHGSIIIYKNSTLTNATWTHVDENHSVVEYTNDANLSITGLKTKGLFIGKDDAISFEPKVEFYLSPGETLTIMGKENSGHHGIMTVGVNWQEDL
jgi:hypothetical protein